MISVVPTKPSESWYIRLLKRPLTHVTVAAILLGLDFVVGPFVEFPITFIIPVALASWFYSARLGYSLAVIQPLIRFGFVFFWDVPWGLATSIANVIIRMTVLLLIAHLISRTARLTRQVKTLEGLLPICSFCKKIRNEQEEWQGIETYISKHSEALFSHSICPECARLNYGEYFKESQS